MSEAILLTDNGMSFWFEKRTIRRVKFLLLKGSRTAVSSLIKIA